MHQTSKEIIQSSNQTGQWWIRARAESMVRLPTSRERKAGKVLPRRSDVEVRDVQHKNQCCAGAKRGEWYWVSVSISRSLYGPWDRSIMGGYCNREIYRQSSFVPPQRLSHGFNLKTPRLRTMEWLNFPADSYTDMIGEAFERRFKVIKNQGHVLRSTAVSLLSYRLPWIRTTLESWYKLSHYSGEGYSTC